MECIICALVRQEIPRWVVDEDATVIAFLPKHPEVFGHTLVAPKAHHPDLVSTPAPLLGRMLGLAQQLSLRYQQYIGAEGVNLLLASGVAAQQSVPHIHLHLMPRSSGDGLDLWPVLASHSFDKDTMLRRLLGTSPA